MNLAGFIRMVLMQVKAELRINLAGFTALSILFTPVLVLTLGKVFNQSGSSFGNLVMGQFIIASMLGGMAGMIVIHLSSDIFTERTSGLLLRTRCLPHGPLGWSIGKSLSSALISLAGQVVVIFGMFLFFDWFDASLPTLLLILGVIALALIAHAPIGLILGAINRNIYSNIIIMGLWFAQFVTSGATIPMHALPGWVQIIQLCLPTYWSTHLTRWVLLPHESGTMEVVGSYQPLWALGIFGVWIIFGFFVAAFIIKRSFRAESIGSLQKIQSAMRSQIGV